MRWITNVRRTRLKSLVMAYPRWNTSSTLSSLNLLWLEPVYFLSCGGILEDSKHGSQLGSWISLFDVNVLFLIYSSHPSVEQPHLDVKIHRPRPLEFIRRTSWDHSLKGALAGIFILLLAVLNLVLFFNSEGAEHNSVSQRFKSVKRVWVEHIQID